jgi:predicted nucleic acid-binding protein
VARRSRRNEGSITAQAEKLDLWLGREPLAIGDLILTEVLQGFAGERVRKTIDTVIATRCIESGYDLLHRDRDFDPFVNHLGLRVVV